MSCSLWTKVKDNVCEGKFARDKQRLYYLPDYAILLYQCLQVTFGVIQTLYI